MNASSLQVEYASVVGLESKGPFPTFKEALKALFADIDAWLKTGNMTYCVLETACWIERTEMKNGTRLDSLPLFFYDARDFSWRVGLLKVKDKATIVREDAEEPSEGVLARLFEMSVFGRGDATAFIERIPKRPLDGTLIDVESLTAFLEEASKEHTGQDWLDRYADKANEELAVDRADFASKLSKAHEAHHGYEAGLRAPEPDHNWAHWYAEHMLCT